MRGPRGVLSGVGVAVGVGVGTGVGVGVGVGVGSGVGVGVGSGVGVGVGIGVGVSLAAPDCAAFKASISQPKALPSVPADLYVGFTTRNAASRTPSSDWGKKLFPG